MTAFVMMIDDDVPRIANAATWRDALAVLARHATVGRVVASSDIEVDGDRRLVRVFTRTAGRKHRVTVVWDIEGGPCGRDDVPPTAVLIE